MLSSKSLYEKKGFKKTPTIYHEWEHEKARVDALALRNLGKRAVVVSYHSQHINRFGWRSLMYRVYYKEKE